jgi:phospholipase/carboxylesterase
LNFWAAIPHSLVLDTEFIPAAEKSSKRLTVVLHGLGDSSAGFHWMPPALDLPWMNYLLVNAPDPYYGGYSWYDFAGDMGPGVRSSRALIFDLLNEQRAAGFPTVETTMLGFSQGCLMTMETGCRYPHLFAGLIGISGYVFEPEELVRGFSPVAREQRFLVTHGHQDPIIPFAMVRDQMQLLQKAGLKITWRDLAKAHTIAGEAELSLIRDFIVAGYELKRAAGG